ncbi:hypothetical protein MAP00_000704 [Monascus purpureus]|nr:hypothetical protein MAP00_000704 [Monascus purpureus]
MEKSPHHGPDGGLLPLTETRDSIPTPPSNQTRGGYVAFRLFRRILVALCLCFALYLYVSRSPISTAKLPSNLQFSGLSGDNSNSDKHRHGTSLTSGALDRVHGCHEGASPSSNVKVPLEVHIMSKCPDARDCLQQLVVPAMEKVDDIVDFRLSFIARVSNKSAEIFCKHGPTECIGDMLILCAANLPFSAGEETGLGISEKSLTPTVRSLGFANCLIDSYERIPERTLVENCALEHGIDFDALNRCASKENVIVSDGDGDGDDLPGGLALLRESALRSEALSVQTSCTIRLDKKVWCVRDDGVWRDCAQGGEGSKVPVFVEEVERIWREKNQYV